MAADIINKQDPTGKAMNPGLVALWEDERLRREAAGSVERERAGGMGWARTDGWK